MYVVRAWISATSPSSYEGHPLEALQSLDRDERVIYMGSFSKTLFPALRVGYLVLPPALVRPFLAAKWAADRFSAPLYQEALAELITSGQFERYLRRAGARNAGRRRALIAALREHFGSRVEIARPEHWHTLGGLAERRASAGAERRHHAGGQGRRGDLLGGAVLRRAAAVRRPPLRLCRAHGGEIRAGVCRLAELL